MGTLPVPLMQRARPRHELVYVLGGWRGEDRGKGRDKRKDKGKEIGKRGRGVRGGERKRWGGGEEDGNERGER